MSSSFNDNFFYHIYPLGMCGAPERNDFASPPADGLKKLRERIPHLVSLGVNALYIGPLFESTSHGYDTVDYWHVDRRLGTDEDLEMLVRDLHKKGIRVILDAVLNHTGRDFFAFRDLREKKELSPYRAWYLNVDFTKRSPEGDPFGYEGWAGYFNLVKLDTANGAVRDHLFAAVRHWIEDFGIDGLRLDAADVLSPDFMDSLAAFCASVKKDFWLMGEVVHGDYRNWARPGRLDSVTNYELYKGLWSSFNDRNFFELAWSLNRQFGPDGMYRHLPLYNFAENHDVNRVASILKNPSHLFPLYGLLFTVPGIPSLYYGGEWGTCGEKKNGSDVELRPRIQETAEQGRWSGMPEVCEPHTDRAKLENQIRALAKLRKERPSLALGSYRQLLVSNDHLAFLRSANGEDLVIAVNAGPAQARLAIRDLPRDRVLKELYSTGAGSDGALTGAGARGHEISLDAGCLKVLELVSA